MHFSNLFLRGIMTFVVTNNIVKGTLEDDYIINPENSIIRNRLKPSIGIISGQIDNNKAIEETSVEKTINNKIEELKSYLQDDDVIEVFDKITFHGDVKGNITGTEVIKKNSLRDDRIKEYIATYKKLQHKIDTTLKLEFISDKTRGVIISTFDNLIAKLNESTCSWESNSKVHTSKVLNDLWNEEWKRLKTNYVEKFKFNEPERMRAFQSFFDGLYTFFSFIIKDMGIKSDKYKIKCKIMDTHAYRKHNDFECDSDSEFHQNHCKRFIICSRELKNFLLDFYSFLNDTTVNVIRNYAEMYDRDGDSFEEKQGIILSIEATSTKMEKVVMEIFIKYTKLFKLDINKDKEENIKALSNYIIETISEVRDNTQKYLNKELKGNEAKTSSVMDDLNLSVKIDLENLQREILGTICFIFRFCNGKYKSRRNGDIYVIIKSKFKVFNLENYNELDNNTLKKNINTTYSYATGKVTRTSPFS